MDDVSLDDVRERHWRMVSEDNDGGVDGSKALLRANRWDVYVNGKESLVEGGYSVDVFGHYRKNDLWGVVNYHVIEEATDNDDIGLRGFNFNLFSKD